MPAIRVGVTGLGVSRALLHYYRDSADTRLVAIHDLDRERLAAVAEECPGVVATTDFAALLASGIDMLDVSTPNHAHAPQAIAALRAGVHVLCQKPMAPTVEDCRRMCAAAHAAGRTLGVLMVGRSQPIAHALKAMIAAGRLGRICAVHQRNAHRLFLRAPDRAHWRGSEANVGGGSFMQLGVHYLDLAQWLLDDEVVRVSAFARNLHCRQALEGEDVAAAAGEFRRGPLITMASGYSSVGNSLAVYGTAGHVVLTDDALRLELDGPWRDDVVAYPGDGHAVGDVVERRVRMWDDRVPATSPHVQQLAFARAVRDGLPAPVPGEVGLRVVATVRALYRSAATGRAVEVDEVLAEPSAAAAG